MYITNIKHLLHANKKMPDEMPQEARELINFLTLVIDATTKNFPNSLTPTDVPCFQKGCNGLIKVALRPDTSEIHWFCSNCESEGLISGWERTKWDNSESNIK